MDDSIQFSLTISNLSGFIESVEWEPPLLSASPKQTSITYDRDKVKWLFFKHSSQKIYCDLNRICEIEDSATEWYEAQYYLRKEDLFYLGWVQPYFQIKDLKYTGVDGGIAKCVLEA